MEAGRIKQIDAPQEIYRRPTSRFVAEFMGEANLIASEQLFNARGETLAGRGMAMIRAEGFDLSFDGIDGDRVSVSGNVASKAFRGENWLINLVAQNGSPIMLSIPASRAALCPGLAVGQSITAYTRAEQIHFLPSEAGA
jgi:putative spermidine/putrescine transport system ATP-binding protein